MPRDRMYVRQFLNEPGHHGGAYLLLSVPDTEGVRGRYVDSTVHFEIADCAWNVQLESPLHDAAARRNTLRKARLLSCRPSRADEGLNPSCCTPAYPKNALSSSTKISGCSIAAKCPPRTCSRQLTRF